ncbi:hypothetical protein [uncultured Mitsuokella sp.]|uniref:hypothetical protein n=1 Tax=uncultured Mitsuokella sp. TaxID=453120 RepID=UPI00265D5444|nr:hypothetical protein [uncultured Mitsuokella sp.]
MAGTLRNYYVDARALSPKEFNELYHRIDGWSFFTSLDIRYPRCFVVHWDREESIESIVDIPDGVSISSMP